MKKILIVLFALALLVGVSHEAFAAAATVTAYAGGTGMGTLRSVTTINTSVNTTTTVADVAIVIPKKVQIIGYEVNVLAGAAIASDGTAQLIDAVAATSGDQDTLSISEIEATVTSSRLVIFPKGLELLTGLTIKQGARTSVTVYYQEVRP